MSFWKAYYDELPEEPGDYLVVVNNNGIAIDKLHVETSLPQGGILLWWEDYEERITHWSRTPSPDDKNWNKGKAPDVAGRYLVLNDDNNVCIDNFCLKSDINMNGWDLNGGHVKGWMFLPELPNESLNI